MILWRGRQRRKKKYERKILQGGVQRGKKNLIFYTGVKERKNKNTKIRSKEKKEKEIKGQDCFN
jgi:hypothetical protein